MLGSFVTREVIKQNNREKTRDRHMKKMFYSKMVSFLSVFGFFIKRFSSHCYNKKLLFLTKLRFSIDVKKKFCEKIFTSWTRSSLAASQRSPCQIAARVLLISQPPYHLTLVIYPMCVLRMDLPSKAPWFAEIQFVFSMLPPSSGL